MKIQKKAILGATVVSTFAVVALASCGGDKTTTYTIEVDPNATNATTSIESASVKNAQELIDQLANAEVVRNGYTFAGWYIDEDCEIALTAETDLSEVTTVYAKYTVNEYTVTYNYNGGSGQVASASANYRQTITAAPTITSAKLSDSGAEMSFIGWYTDSALTTEFKFGATGTEVTGDITLYAKWDIISISTAAEFTSYVNSNQTINAELTGDIDMAGTTISRNKADIDADLLSSSGDTYTQKLTAVFDGNGHKVSNLNITGDSKAGLFGTITGAVKNIEFESVTCDFSASTYGPAGFLCNTIEGNAIIEDVTFDGITAKFAASGDGTNGIIAAKGTESANISISGVTILDANMAAYKYSGGLIGQFLGDSIDIKDTMIELVMTNANQGCGGVIGQMKEASKNFTADGLVLDITISGSGTKNIGAVIGDSKQNSASTVSISNSVVLKADLSATENAKINTFVGQTSSNVTLELTNANYRTYGVKLTAKSERIDPTQGTAITNDSLATVLSSTNEEFTYDTETSTFKLNGNSMAAPSDPTVMPVTNLPSVTADVSTSSNGTGTWSIASVTIPYVQAATAGKAGNAITVTMTAPIGITDISTARVTGDAYNPTITSTTTTRTIRFYVYVDKTELTDVTNITKYVNIVWYENETQIAQTCTYAIRIASDVSFADTLESGAMTLTDATGFTLGSVENNATNVLNITAGTIAWNEGNMVNVTIAKPTWASAITTLPTIDNKNATAAWNTDQSAITVTLPVTAGTNKFTVKWSDATDAQTYTIIIGDSVTLASNPNGPAVGAVVTLDATELEVVNDQNDSRVSVNYVVNETFTILGEGTKIWRTDGQKINLSKGKMTATTNGVQITLTGAANITVYGCSSKDNGSGYHFAVMSGGSIIKTSEEINLAGNLNDSYDFNNVSAGTVVIGGDTAGVHISKIVVTYLA